MTSQKVYVKWQWRHFLGRMKSYNSNVEINKDKILLQMNLLQFFKLKKKMLLAICDVTTDRFISILYLVNSNELITLAERTMEESLTELL
jgi:hypothetical protein